MAFVCFDIVEFYPTITEELLTCALSLAKQYANIDQREEDAIMHSRRSLPFSGERQWVKKKNSAFDVTVGSFDGAEVCELVDAFLLSELSQHKDQSSVGLYRDDGLAVVRDMSGSAADRLRKTIATVFQQHGLKITIDVNMRVVDFLDVTLNLDTGKYKPFRKPNNTPLYLSTRSNHPPMVLRNLHKAIERRGSDISADQQTFDEVVPLYQNSLKSSGFASTMNTRGRRHVLQEGRERTVGGK